MKNKSFGDKWVEFDERLLNWIKNNKRKYYLIIALLGYGITFSFFALLGNPETLRLGFSFGTVITSIFFITDYYSEEN